MEREERQVMGNSGESGVADTEIVTKQSTPPQEQETPSPEQGESFQLRGGSFTLMVLKLIDPTSESFFAGISEKARLAPNFFRNAAVVLDLDGLPENQACDFGDIKARLRRCDLMVVGVQGGHRPHHEAALRSGLPLVPSGRPTRTSTRTAAPQVPPPRSTLVVSEVVRSGRQLYAPGGDLVVTAMVSPGAELLADGHIHVYGALRGRALAGLSGDTNARIFCMSLEAEMVSIAGLYQVNEDFDPAIVRKPVQIYLKEGYLCVESFASVTR